MNRPRGPWGPHDQPMPPGPPRGPRGPWDWHGPPSGPQAGPPGPPPWRFEGPAFDHRRGPHDRMGPPPGAPGRDMARPRGPWGPQNQPMPPGPPRGPQARPDWEARRRVRMPDRKVRLPVVLKDATSIAGAGRKIAKAHRRERRDATWLSRADRGARKTSRCLPVRLAGRKPGRIGMARRRVRMPDRKVRLQVVLKDAASIAGADRKIAKAHRREHRDAN